MNVLSSVYRYWKEDVILLMKRMRMFKKLGLVACLLTGVMAAEGETAPLSLSLDDSVQMALQVHQTIISADAQAESARWQMKSARRNGGPTLTWNSTGYKVGGRDYRRADYNSTFNNSLTLSIPLYSGGRIEHTAEQYRYQANSADMGTEAARQAVRYQTTEAYYELLRRQYELEVMKKTVEMADNQIHLLNVQFVEGAIARSDVLQMEVQKANYMQDLLGAQGSLAVARTTFLSVLGLPENTDFEVKDGFDYVPFKMQLEDCLDYALAHRPDKLSADYAVKSAAEQKEAAKHDYRPKVQGVISKSIVGKDAFGQDRNANWQAGIQLEWKLFDNQMTKATVKAAQMAEKKLEADAAETERKVLLDTRSAYLNMRAAEEKISVAKSAVAKAEKSNHLAEVRYREGVDTILNVMDSMDKLTKARTNYYAALYEYSIYKAGLDWAMGVPVRMDVPRYVRAVQEGRSPAQAEERALISPEMRDRRTE